MTIYLEPENYRKSGAERRTGVDRRHPILTRHVGVERRKNGERRASSDRRGGVSSATLKAAAKPKFLNILFKNRFSRPKARQSKRRQASFDGQDVHLDAHIPRAHERSTCEIPVKVLDRDTYEFVPATVYNFSKAGMYLESEYAPRLGSGLAIRMVNHSKEAAEPEDVAKYHSQVKWCHKIAGNVVFLRYGIGVRHCTDLEDFFRLFSF